MKKITSLKELNKLFKKEEEEIKVGKEDIFNVMSCLSEDLLIRLKKHNIHTIELPIVDKENKIIVDEKGLSKFDAFSMDSIYINRYRFHPLSYSYECSHMLEYYWYDSITDEFKQLLSDSNTTTSQIYEFVVEDLVRILEHNDNDLMSIHSQSNEEAQLSSKEMKKIRDDKQYNYNETIRKINKFKNVDFKGIRNEILVNTDKNIEFLLSIDTPKKYIESFLDKGLNHEQTLLVIGYASTIHGYKEVDMDYRLLDFSLHMYYEKDRVVFYEGYSPSDENTIVYSLTEKRITNKKISKGYENLIPMIEKFIQRDHRLFHQLKNRYICESVKKQYKKEIVNIIKQKYNLN